MARLAVRIEAELNALEAALWCEGERGGFGSGFLDELRAAFTRVEQAPLQFPVVSRSLRRAILRRFPFRVFFTLEGEEATDMAIMHLHRDRKEWQRRE